LKNKGPYLAANKVNRSSLSSFPKDYELKKVQYNKRLAKISDRYIPKLLTCDQL